MALAIPSDFNLRLSDAPLLTVEIDGVYRADAEVSQIVESSGAQASLITLEFRSATPGSRPVRPFDKVVVYLNKHWGLAPKFVGYVTDPGRETFDAAIGSRINATALDLRHFLNDDICLADYNYPNPVDGQITNLAGSRQIVREIHDGYESHQAGISGSRAVLGLDLASFPDVPVGEFRCKGQPRGQALQTLISQISDGSYRLQVVYSQSGGGTLRCWKAGQGRSQFVNLSVDNSNTAFNNPNGYVNVGSGDKQVDQNRVVNEVVAESPYYIRERAVALGPDFDVTRYEDQQALLGVALVPPGENTDNPKHDPGAERFGRYWRIPPQYDSDGVLRRLRYSNQLLQSQLGESAVFEYFATRPESPFLAYRFNAADDFTIQHDGFSVKDSNLVVTSKPLIQLKSDLDDQQTLDIPLILNEWHTQQNGNELFGFMRNGESQTQIDFQPYIDGTLAVQSESSGAGQALNVLPYGEANVETLQPGDLFLQPSTGQAYLYISRWNPSKRAAPNALKAPDIRQVFFRRAVGPTTAEPTKKMMIPVEIYLQAGFQSQIPFSASSGLIGSAGGHVKRLTTKSGAALHVGSNWFKLEATSAELGDWTATKTDWGEDSWTQAAGATVFRDDSTRLQAMATQAAEATKAPLIRNQYNLPNMPVGFKIGSLIYENGKNTGGNIKQITYDLDSNTVAIEVQNR